MRYLVVAIVLIIVVSSCRKDFTTVRSYNNLFFSKDTVFLDTVFTKTSSATYNLKVYNKSDKNITISSIALQRGNASKYRLNVDGTSGKAFKDIDILAKDSMYIFIETSINFNEVSNPLYTDKIVFSGYNSNQFVSLVTLVKDAIFLYPKRDAKSLEIDSLILNKKKITQGRFLKDNELEFTNKKPYVVYGYIAVPENKTLTIDAGANIHFHKNSGLIIDKNASIKVNGTLKEKVVFQGDRLEHSYSNIPGQWGAIWLRAGSKNNEIKNAQIKNGTIGVLVDSMQTKKPTLTIENSEIYNHSSFGILARETSIKANNLVVGSAGKSSFAGTMGGAYSFTHCTFANFWKNGLRTLPSVLINNFFTYKKNGKEIIKTQNLYKANFTNCIIYGNNNIEFMLNKVSGGAFNYNIKNCLIRFDDTGESYKNNAELNFSDTTHYSQVLLNKDPDFKDALQNEFIIGEKSGAVKKAHIRSALLFPTDILGVSRTSNPDIGAYQHTVFKK